MTGKLSLTGNELFFNDDDVIVSKTNTKGHLTYCNDIFLKLAGYTERELLGQPHSIVRHPHMPRSIFKLLWDTLRDGREIFAYVVNRSKNGDHYWVNAHVTPSFDLSGNIIGYHSNRRTPDRQILEQTIIPLYDELLDAEQKPENRKEGLAVSTGMVASLLQDRGVAYDEFINIL